MYPSTNFSITAIHGNGGGGFRFDLARPLFPDNVNFHNPSLPGFDCNKKQTKKLTIKEYADWLADYISDVPRPNILMGHGLGGVFVLEFLQKYSYLVDGVILHSIVGANLNKRIFPKLMKLPMVAFLIKNLIASPAFRPIISRKFFQNKIDSNYEKLFFQAFGKCEVFENMFQIINYSWFKSLSKIHLPTIFLWGEKDWILTPNEINELQSLFQNSSKLIISDWDHFPMIDKPESYVSEITKIARDLATLPNVTK
ncbi:MAG: alpha/beta hydrolase [Flavobacteriaceae bacterium]|nr:alpha/beta hydrolase [Flavobacteriaceae bacterium]